MLRPPTRFRILLIEDDARRERWFRAQLPVDIPLSWAPSAGTALGAIRRDRGHIWGGVLLDHDLDLRNRTADDRDLCGTDVALALMECFSLDIPILVHSTNQVQAPRVVRQLEQKGFWVTHCPFYNMNEQVFAEWLSEARAIWADVQGDAD